MQTTLGAIRPTTGEAMLEAVRALAPTIAAAAPEGERLRRLPDGVYQAMKEAGVFAMAMPRAWGGPELDPIEQLRVIEALSEADASAGWCAMVGCDGGFWTAYLDQEVARAMYPDITVSTAGSGAPAGRAVRVRDGWRVSGRWPFSSGCHHAAWLGPGCLIVEEDGAFATRADGRRTNVRCFLPRRDVEILDTWHTTGLAGSGSADFTVTDHFVPFEHSFARHEMVVRREGALYRTPFGFLLKAAAPALGVARAAIDALIDAANKSPVRRPAPAGESAEPRLLRDEAYVQDAVGRAEALWGSARAYLYEVVAGMWETIKAGDMPDRAAMARFTLANMQAFEGCAEAVHLCYRARGGGAVYAAQPLDRCLRDITTMTQHAFVSLRGYGLAGRGLLGLPGDVMTIGVI